MADLKLDHITKEYRAGTEDDIVAVDDLNLTLEDGEFLVLVGPSGCGKSTTLHCIAGLETVTEGDIRIDGDVVNERNPEERNIAMVFQNYALYPHMTARENMSFGLRMATDLSSEEISQRVQDAAEMLGIEELLDDKPKELSGGQQQRVALGRAIVREPDVFLMDEPLSNLDAKLRTHMRTEIQQLQSELGVTTVYVTHDQTEAMTMGDRIAVLDGGELQQVGTPMELYHQPTNRFVADFIGEPSMNFFQFQRDGTALTNPSFDYELTDSLAAELGQRDRVTLGIRPEDIVLADSGGPQTVPVTVDVVEPMGDENFLHASRRDETITAAVPGDVQVEEGSRVWLEFPPSRIHLFDERTGEAIVNCEPYDAEPPAFVPEGEFA